MDLAFDHALFTVDDVNAALDDGNWRSPALKYKTKIETEYDRSGPLAIDNCTRVGVRQSARMLRVYDRHGFVRLELEIKDDWANPYLGQLLELAEQPSDMAYLAMGILRNFIDFVDSGSVADKAEPQLLPWWKQFVGAAPIAASPDRKSRKRAPGNDSWVMNSAKAISIIAEQTGRPFSYAMSILTRGLQKQGRFLLDEYHIDDIVDEVGTYLRDLDIRHRTGGQLIMLDPQPATALAHTAA